MPWAESAGTSFLLTEPETIQALARAGFQPGTWKDVTAEAVASFGQQQPPPVPGQGLAAVMGPRFMSMAANLARSIREGRVRLVMGVCEQVPSAP